MKKILTQIQFFRAFLKLVGDPNKTENIFRMSEAALKNTDHPSARAFLETVMKNEAFAKLYKDSYLPKKITRDELLAFPEGSLGQAYGTFLKDHDLQADFYPTLFPTTPLEYLTLRMRQTHDIFHVLTGFGTSLTDEIAMQAFLVAQTGSAFSGLLIVAALLHTLKSQPQNLRAILGSVATGYKMGRQSSFLLGAPWETLWDKPLQELVLKYVFGGEESAAPSAPGEPATDDLDQLVDLRRHPRTITA